MNEKFVQIMDKFNEQLQWHVESWAMSEWYFITAGYLRCVEWWELGNPPC
jgi:hypothetical protein